MRKNYYHSTRKYTQHKFNQKNNKIAYIFLSFSIIMLLSSLFFLTWTISKNKNYIDHDKFGGADTNLDSQNLSNDFIVPDIQKITEQIGKSQIVDNSTDIILPFSLTSQSVFLYDLDSDEILYSKNPELVVAPASLTKIMTAIILLENVDDLKNTYAEYSDELTAELGNYGYNISELSNYGFVDGEKVNLEDVLYALMLRSGNDAANLIANYVGNNSIENFVDMMNSKAKEIGAVNTNFSNPHGLDSDDHYTTAYDMFLITKYAMSLPGFMEVSESSLHQMQPTNLRPEVTIATVIDMQNPINSSYSFYYEYLKGIKTGYTDEAGKCLISSAEKDGRKLILVLMGTPLKDSSGNSNPRTLFYEETKMLYEWAYNK